VIWQSPYTDLLFEAIADAYDPKKGYYEGIFENGTGPIRIQTANNNGIMLEALQFKVQGKLLKWGRTDGGLWESTNANPFADSSKGRPIFIRRSQQCRGWRETALSPRLFRNTRDGGCANCAPEPDCEEDGKGSLQPREFGPNYIERAIRRAPDTTEICLICEDERFRDYSPSWHVRAR
jgi:hypothetical protein